MDWSAPRGAERSGRLTRLSGLLPLACLGCVAAVVVAIYLVAVGGAYPPHPDLEAYRRAAADFVNGRPLYADFLPNSSGDATLRPAFIYPPIAAAILAPIALIPSGLLPWLWLAATQLALLTAMVLTFRGLGFRTAGRSGALVLLLAVAITFGFFPLWVDASQGQLNLFVLLLVIAAIVGIGSEKPRRGVLLGLAAAIKVTPALLLTWLLWERRVRALLWTLTGFGVASAIGFALRPGDTIIYIRQVLPALSRGTAYYSNQSFAGVAGRLLTLNPYTRPLAIVGWEPALVMLAGAAMLAVWVLSLRRVLSPVLRGITMLPLFALLSPVSWEHHLVILLPVVWMCLIGLRAHRWPVFETIVFGVAVVCLLALPHLPIGPPYATPFARASATANPLLILGANRLFVGTVVLFWAGIRVARLSGRR